MVLGFFKRILALKVWLELLLSCILIRLIANIRSKFFFLLLTFIDIEKYI